MRERRRLTARDWVIVTGGGVAIAVFGLPVVGVLFVVVGVLGLLWSLVGDR